MRVIGLTANGPAAVGALMVGLPPSSKVIRTTKSLPWLTTQQALVASEQSMSTGADGNRRSVLSRTCASSSPAGRSKLMPLLRLKVWSASSSPLSRSNTDSRLCTLTLRRSGGSGEAAVLGTKPRSPKRTMLSSRFGKAPVVCACVPSVPPSAKIVRGASVGVAVDEGAAGDA